MGRGGGAHPAGCGGREPAPAQAQVPGAVRRPRPRHARYEHSTRTVCVATLNVRLLLPLERPQAHFETKVKAVAKNASLLTQTQYVL